MSDKLPEDNRSDDKKPGTDEPWFDRAAALVKDIGEQGMEHPSSQNVLIGAALGFMLGTTVYESLGFLWGAFIGAALAIAYELEKQDKQEP